MNISVFGLDISIRRRPRFSAASTRTERMCAAFRSGRTPLEVAEKFGVSENRVRQVLNAAGARRPRWRKMSRETRKEVFRLRSQGLSKAEIGRRVGVSRERVRQILAEGA
jgi:DNA-directed RNA polymerase sigma subunit (sigma70/sigma32)